MGSGSSGSLDYGMVIGGGSSNLRAQVCDPQGEPTVWDSLSLYPKTLYCFLEHRQTVPAQLYLSLVIQNNPPTSCQTLVTESVFSERFGLVMYVPHLFAGYSGI